MADISSTGLTSSQLLDTFRQLQNNPTATVDDMFANVMGAKAVFVSPLTMSVNDLLATYPASASTLGRYARVNDLWGSVKSVMICEGDASGFYWRPQRTDYAGAPVTQTGGTLPLVPLVTAPVVNVVGTLAGNVSIAPSATNVWPGATFTVSCNSILGLFGVNITGLVGGGTVPLATGGMRMVTYFSGTGWKAS